jgi:hypothetical protein
MNIELRLACCLAVAALGLAACKPIKAAEDSLGGHARGRYQGIGIYTPQEAWTKLAATQQAKDTSAARPIDDQAIIVVVDSVTGEVRACGDLTGYCIGMNPWKSALVAAQVAPINLTEHAKPPASPDTPAASSAAASQ